MPFDTPEQLKEFRKAEIAQLEADCRMQEESNHAEEAARNRTKIQRLKRDYKKEYDEDI